MDGLLSQIFSASDSLKRKDRLAGASGNVPAAINKASANVLPSNTENIGQPPISNAGIVKGFSPINIKSGGNVRPMVSGLIDDGDVLNPVVRLNPIDVMDMLGREKFAPNMVLHDKSMLVDLPSINRNHSISSGIKSGLDIPSGMTGMATENPLLIGADGASMLLEGNAASWANEGLSHIGNIRDIPSNGNIYTLVVC